MFLKSFLRGALDNRIFNLPLQYRITKYRSRLLRTEPPRRICYVRGFIFSLNWAAQLLLQQRPQPRRKLRVSALYSLPQLSHFLFIAPIILTLYKSLKCQMVNVVLLPGNIKFNHSVGGGRQRHLLQWSGTGRRDNG